MYYAYSDSLQEYRKGQEELAEIRRVVKELGEAGETLYKEFRNEKFTIQNSFFETPKKAPQKIRPTNSTFTAT